MSGAYMTCTPDGHVWDRDDEKAKEAHRDLHGEGAKWGVRAATADEAPLELPFRAAMDVLVHSQNAGNVKWVVPDLVYGGGVTLLSGPPKKGKSTLLAQMAQSRFTGDDFIDLPVRQGPTLLLTEEGEYPFVYRWARAAQAAENAGQVFDALLLGDVVKDIGKRPAWRQVLDGIRWWCKGYDAPLVIIDTLAQWAGIEDENDASEATKAIGLVDAIAHETGAAIVLVHHTRKGGGSGGEAIRGSSAILATVGVSMELRAPSESSDDRTLYTQGRVILGDSYHLSFDRESLTYSGSTKEPADTLPEARKWADSLPSPHNAPDGLTLQNLMALWEVGRSSAQRRIVTMLDKGVLREEAIKDGRTWRKVYHVIPPLPRQPLVTSDSEVDED